MLTKVLNSFGNAIHGLRTVLEEEHNFKIEITISAVVTFCLFYFHFSYIESALCVVAIIMVLIAEIANTALEDLCDKVEPKYDSVIAKIKDTSGAFVLVAVLGAVIIGSIVFFHHFIYN